MNEELINKEIQNSDSEKLMKLESALNKLKNKDSKIMFCVPTVQNPSASIYEIYFHATVVKKMGYNVLILTEKEEYEIPKWIDSELLEHVHSPMSKNNLTVGPEDIMVIPETFSNIMEQTKNLPCLRVGLLQSVDYMLNALIPGTDWRSFGIEDIITTSDSLKNFIEINYGKGKFKIKTYDIGIPDYFKKSEIPQKPIVSIVGRNPNEISKFVKLFFSKYPQYSWITFDPMLTKSKPPQPMRRKDFAERLRNNFAAIWVDRISSFGTFPLECMKSGVIPISLVPDITPDYIIERDENGTPIKIKDNCGIWTDSFYDLPTLLGNTIIKFLDDNIGDQIYETMSEIVSKYTQENSENKIIDVYDNIINERVGLFEKILKENNLNNKKEE
jgi:hypothetical protein